MMWIRWSPVDENGYPIDGYMVRYAHDEDMSSAIEAVPSVAPWIHVSAGRSPLR